MFAEQNSNMWICTFYETRQTFDAFYDGD